VNVDSKQGDRATELKFTDFRRPHMRSFYISTFSFFIAFLSWFSFAPLMPEVKKNLGLTKDEVYTANITAVTATVATRFLIGPLCDAFGARQTFAILLLLGAIPTYLSGLVQNAQDLALVRFFIGILGATFVCNQAWSAQMFAKEIVGAANATSAGWGNLGGGVTQFFMTALWTGFKQSMDSEKAWRVSFVVPASIVVLCSFATLFLADDSPKGNFKDLINHGVMIRKSSKKSAELAYKNHNSWVLAVHYGCCFGIELVVFNVCTSYFHDKFSLSTTKASLVATLFGFLNIFSRSMGGALSDFLSSRFTSNYEGMRGRLISQFLCLLAEGISIIVFSRMDKLANSIIVLVFFSLGVQMSNGSTYSIIPFVCPEATGAVSGIAGAGGSVGAIMYGLVFRFGPSAPEDCFLILGICVLACACTVPLIRITGYDSLFCKAKGEPAAIDVV
jgi:NNP family nitrate/nitrite transporter-like MFS transporter